MKAPDQELFTSSHDVSIIDLMTTDLITKPFRSIYVWTTRTGVARTAVVRHWTRDDAVGYCRRNYNRNWVVQARVDGEWTPVA